MIWLWITLGIVGAIILLPLLFYLCAKLGAIGKLQGQKRFRELHNDEETNYADQP